MHIYVYVCMYNYIYLSLQDLKRGKAWGDCISSQIRYIGRISLGRHVLCALIMMAGTFPFPHIDTYK